MHSEIHKFVARWTAIDQSMVADLRARKAKTLETGIDHMGGQPTDGFSAFLTKDGDPYGGPEDNHVPVVVGVWPIKICAKRAAEEPRFRLSTEAEINAFTQRTRASCARCLEEQNLRENRKVLTVEALAPVPTKASTK
jgi:hypothetical protein